MTTLSIDGALNAAPYSLFNVVSHDPPVIMIAVLPHPERRLEDTAANIFATREFVVNLVRKNSGGAYRVRFTPKERTSSGHAGSAAWGHERTLPY